MPQSSHQPVRTLAFSLELVEGQPQIIVTSPDAPDSRILGRYGTDVQHLLVPLEAGSVERIIALDVVEHVLDEQAFLQEVARLLRLGGRLDVRVPAQGVTGWMDALNLYRFLADFSHRGRQPQTAFPAGWHRHYSSDDIVDLITDVGFDVTSNRRVNPGFAELPHFGGFLVGDMLLKRPDIETRLDRWRRQADERANRIPAAIIGTRHELVAYRT